MKATANEKRTDSQVLEEYSGLTDRDRLTRILKDRQRARDNASREFTKKNELVLNAKVTWCFGC